MDMLNNYLTLGNLLLAALLILLFTFWQTKAKIRIIIPYLISLILSIYIYEEIVLKSEYDFTVSLGDYSSGNYFKKEVPNIGYGPPQEGIYSSIKLINSDTIYNVNYTIEDKIRVTPSSNDKATNQIVFLGCSQTFGEGLNDNETLPNYFGKITKERFKIKNFGFHGYGPHNIHSLIKHDLSPNLSNSNTTIALYNFYWYHINRAVNNVSDNEPWYEVENNQLMLKGTFRERDGGSQPTVLSKYITAFTNRVIKRANIYKNHFSKSTSPLNLNEVNKRDIERSLFLIKDMSKILKLAKVNFIVVVDEITSKNRIITNFFKNNQIQLICLECEIPDLYDNDFYYIPIDGHHSHVLNSLKAEILREKLLSLGFIGS